MVELTAAEPAADEEDVVAEERVEQSLDGDGAAVRDLERQLRLGLLDSKRAAVIALRDGNQIDDIVLREVQATLDIEEVRLLGPAVAD